MPDSDAPNVALTGIRTCTEMAFPDNGDMGRACDDRHDENHGIANNNAVFQQVTRDGIEE
jgi:hypothetical protein